MGDFKMGSKTVMSQSGTSNPTWGANAPTNAIIRVFHQTSTADITVTSGTTIVTGATQTLTPTSDTCKFLISYSYNKLNVGLNTSVSLTPACFCK